MADGADQGPATGDAGKGNVELASAENRGNEGAATAGSSSTRTATLWPRGSTTRSCLTKNFSLAPQPNANGNSSARISAARWTMYQLSKGKLSWPTCDSNWTPSRRASPGD
eukprot:9198341-Heterocapsa_arctica.AAC.1